MVLSCLCLLAFPVGARTVQPRVVSSDRWDVAVEKAIGRVVAGAFEAADGRVVDPVLSYWLDSIGSTVAMRVPESLKPRFLLVDNAVANAWSVPGGTVVVTRGLLEFVDSDDALATVLAHECAHVARRHAWKQITENLGVLALLGSVSGLGRTGRQVGIVANVVRALGRSRAMEHEADRLGVEFAHAAGWDPRAFLSFLGDGGGGVPNWLSSHPSDRERRGAVGRRLENLAARPNAASPRRWRPLPALQPSPDPDGRRGALLVRCSGVRSRLMSTSTESGAGGALQQMLLLTTDPGRPVHLVLSSRAWAIQQRVGDLEAGIARTAAVAPSVWDRLEAADRVEAAVGRGELQLAVATVEAELGRLAAARRATALVMANLNVRGLPSRRFSVSAPEAAVQEGLLRHAESLLGEAGRRVAESWRLVSQARIRAYGARIGTLAGGNPARLAWLRENLARRTGGVLPPATTIGDCVREVYARALGVPAGELAGLTGASDLPAAVGGAGGAPTAALLLRLMVLDAEREWE